MHPILFRIPLPGITLPLVGKLDSIPIYSYGVMLGLSLVVGWYLTLGLAERDGLPRETMANNYVITAVVAVLGSRVLYVLTNLNEFDTLSKVFSMREGGLVAYGGFLGGFVGSWAYLKAKKIRLLPWADVAVPSLASGLAITRIGCYLFGCDYGKPLSEGAPGFLKAMGTFPKWPPGTLAGGPGSPAWHEHATRNLIDSSAAHSLPVHPTQIYESLVGLGLLGLLLVARRRQRFRGQVCFTFFFAYGFFRFLLEILRDDPERGSLPLTLPEHVLMPLSLGVFAVAYSVAFARMIEGGPLRRATQVLSFAPAVVAAVVLRPASFAAAQTISLSTSQVIGLGTAVIVAAAYVVFDNAAVAHPEAAMELGLPAPDEPPAEEEDEPEDVRAKKPTKKSAAKPAAKKNAGAKKKKAGKKRKPRPSDDEDANALDGSAAGEEAATVADGAPAGDKAPDEEPADDALVPGDGESDEPAPDEAGPDEAGPDEKGS